MAEIMTAQGLVVGLVAQPKPKAEEPKAAPKASAVKPKPAAKAAKA